MSNESQFFLNGKQVDGVGSLADLSEKAVAGEWNYTRGAFRDPDSVGTQVKDLLSKATVNADTAKVSTALSINGNAQYHWAYVWYMKI